MEALTENDIRQTMRNCSRGEARRLWIPDLKTVQWDDLEYLGWRDPKAGQRGAIVCSTGDGPLGLVLRAPSSPIRRTAQCALCECVHHGNVALFVAPRAGEAGRNASTVGTYICDDLACSTHIRASTRPTREIPDPAPLLASRTAQLQERLQLFTANVLAPGHQP